MPTLIEKPDTFPLTGHKGEGTNAEIDTYFDCIAEPKGREMSVAVVKMRPNTALQEHFHRKTQESFLVVSGTCIAVVDGAEFHLGKNMLLVVSPQEKHFLRTDEHGGAEVVAISVPAHDSADFYPV